MRHKFIAAALLSALALNLVALLPANAAAKTAGPVSPLVALLPSSDGVVLVDAKRFFNDALPRVLASKPALLDEVTKKIAELQEKAGIDIRQFETVAVGLNLKRTTPGKFDIDPVILARGQVNAPGLVGTAKLASNGKYREEHFGGKTVYVFSAKTAAAQAGKQAGSAVDKVAGSIADEVAVTAFDANTVAIGSIGRMQEALGGKTKVGADVSALLGRGTSPIASFAFKTPEGMNAIMPLDNDELGKSLGSIRYLFGYADLASDAAVLNLTAKTLQNAQAQSLFDTLQGLKVIGKAALGNANTPEKQVIGRMIDSAKVTTSTNEVALDLRVPQADIDLLVGTIK